MALHTIDSLVQRVTNALEKAGASHDMALSTARALVAAEAQGMGSHGLSRVGQYASHLRSGRVNGAAVPAIRAERGAGVLVDADEGLAFPACEFAVREAIARARQYAIGFAGVTRSHHFGVAALHLEAAAQAGMVAFAFSNSPAAMPAPGGTRALFGTNPIAAVFPRRDGSAVSIDLSLSEVARGKLMVAAREGREIPLGWALDKHGKPTTDPKAGLDGMMCPAGGVKGAMLALMVELLCVALTGAAFAFEADSFFSAQGNRPHVGHVFLAIDPSALAGNDVYFERVETLMEAMLADEQVRIPGARRAQIAVRSAANGIEVPDAMIQELDA
ncbi:Ldh family oxidoreductase [Parapusillimonas granuli]|uniref:Ldh family oxidoreductase n=1 Tax=Parapusillimonas granuli TaxID=380911 RepID=A0A853FYT4_9BURK|nr:Ldh family oxidoreductase [Parapusillimonas granuli]MBB5216110.1 (2R)-3-sulfolactate dehydrogenase (NADP+) [Parapusillimonas granuli]NYT47791.1 Ldh family oxidoreductase [Parapusillimonas granuli]